MRGHILSAIVRQQKSGVRSQVAGGRRQVKSFPTVIAEAVMTELKSCHLPPRPATCIHVLNFSFTLRHALLQGICGLSGPRSRQETDREWSDRDKGCARPQ